MKICVTHNIVFLRLAGLLIAVCDSQHAQKHINIKNINFIAQKIIEEEKFKSLSADEKLSNLQGKYVEQDLLQSVESKNMSYSEELEQALTYLKKLRKNEKKMSQVFRNAVNGVSKKVERKEGEIGGRGRGTATHPWALKIGAA